MPRITLEQALTLEDKLWLRVDKSSECWVWRNLDGQVPTTRGKPSVGKIRFGSRTDGTRSVVNAPTLSWIIANRKEPELHILHHCDYPPCVRPDHLYEGTHTQNMADVRTRKRQPKAKQTHCIHGHEFTDENTIVYSNGTRHCRKCGNERSRKNKGE